MIDKPSDAPFNAAEFSIHRPHSCQGPETPKDIATVLRTQVRELRELQKEHGPECHGHPVGMGHILALRIADLLDPPSNSSDVLFQTLVVPNGESL